jgi:hypothetical protein
MRLCASIYRNLLNVFRSENCSEKRCCVQITTLRRMSDRRMRVNYLDSPAVRIKGFRVSCLQSVMEYYVGTMTVYKLGNHGVTNCRGREERIICVPSCLKKLSGVAACRGRSRKSCENEVEVPSSVINHGFLLFNF